MKPRFKTAKPISSADIAARLDTFLTAGEAHVIAETGFGGEGLQRVDIGRRYEVEPAYAAPVESATATARYENGRLDLWIATQAPEQARLAAARAIGISTEDVALYPMPAGGSFDARLEHDHAIEIALIARELGRPVQLTWSRRDELVRAHPRAPTWLLLGAQLAKNGDGTIDAMMFLGIATEAITNGGWGKVTTTGNVGSFKTSAWPKDTILYASETVAGGVQTNAPTAVKLPIAVTLDSKLNGTILVRSTQLDLNKYVEATDATYTQTVAKAATAAQLAGENVFTGNTNIWTAGGDGTFDFVITLVDGVYQAGWRVLGTIGAALNAGGLAYNGVSVIDAGNKSLLGPWSTTGQLSPQSYSATITPTPLSYVTNLTISAANGIQQALTNYTGALTITWPAGSAATETTISLTVPPRGTNTYTLAAGPTYYYVSPLTSTNALSTNLITRLWYASPWGTTNASVTISGEVAP
jgi:hypothetical protein